ncbi:hypothetical protein CM240_0281 [Clostridium bornimense]|uniref:DUF218 domain-containing protein n=1 Tax=Clostridium bornimense TaxID=1216932 RepID=W6RT71_9CLOT|nr:YdcF family protein [Clostridium bornimense]CDM67448.1 hypothetical protein CM240_0281 [Clostridium bornimense]
MNKKVKWMNKVLIFIGCIFVIYYLALRFFYGKIAFSETFFIVGVLLIAYNSISLKKEISIWDKIPKIFRSSVFILFSICLVIFLFVECIIIYNGFVHDKGKPDYVVVLGAGLRGSRITTALRCRLDAAVEYNKLYPEVPIVVSGGQGPDEDLSEAEAMKNYLITNGVNEELIIEEDKSTNTYENFKFTKRKLKEIDDKKNITITVITNNFHMYRAKLLAEDIGFKCLRYPSPGHKALAVNFYVREFFAVIKAIVFGY